MTTPAVGRIVHHVSGERCHAAIIREVCGDACADLTVFGAVGTTPHEHVTLDDGHEATHEPQMCTTLYHEPGTWHWPARV